MPLVGHSSLFCRGLRPDPARATVVADAINGNVIHHRSVVSVVNIGDVNIVDSAVVIERSIAPCSARVSIAGVAKTVVDASVKADMRPPVTRMPQERLTTPSPVTMRPQNADLRRHHPGSGYPEIAFRPVCPITRGPDITDTGAKRLRIYRQRRRSDPC